MSSDDGGCALGALLCKDRERGRKQFWQSLAEGRVMEGQTVLATKVSPKTATVMAGEHLAQLGSKQKKAWIGQ